jgi:hypothetical protein
MLHGASCRVADGFTELRVPISTQNFIACIFVTFKFSRNRLVGLLILIENYLADENIYRNLVYCSFRCLEFSGYHSIRC